MMIHSPKAHGCIAIARLSTMAGAMTLLAACAAPSSSTSASTGDPNEVICTREYPTGSNLPVNRCRTQAQIAKEREDAQRAVEAISRNPGQTTRD